MSGAATLRSIAGAVRSGALRATDVAGEALRRIAASNALLNAFRETLESDALRAAERIDAVVARGEDPGPLAGVPIAVKDNIATRAGQTCCGSRMLEGYRSPYDATAVARLIAAGAVIVGKTNCDEFAMGSSTEHCAFGVVRNPHDTDRVPGGSSGGSAVAVAAGMVPAALGSDTGGSIRQPAAMCGIVGVKPTYGRVSRAGLVAFGSSLDQVGPMTQDVGDAALLLDVMAGRDELDATSADRDVPDCFAGLDAPIDDLRIGVARDQLAQVEPPVRAALEQAIAILRERGASIVDVRLSLTDHAISTYYVLATAEASSNLARFDGIRYGRRAGTRPGDDLEAVYARSRAEGFGPEVRRRIMLGTYVLSAGYRDAYYRRAQQVRRLITQEFERAFDVCHAILGPATPGVAFPIGEKSDPLAMYLCDVFTTGANIAGHCAISVPMRGLRGLPVGVQVQCRAFDEPILFRIARMLESAPRGVPSDDAHEDLAT